MKAKRLICVATAVCLGIAGAAAHAGSTYSQVFAFGDSLSDAGDYSIYAANPANGLAPQPVSPYVGGLWSNGPTWVMDLSKEVGAGTLTASLSGGNDFAYSGSVPGTTLLGTASFRDLPAQFSQFEAANPTGAPAGALYTVESGINDVIGAVNRYEQSRLTLAQTYTVVSQAAADEATFVSDLHADGADTFLIYLSPDAGTTPDFNATSYSGLATTLSQDFNADLETDLAALAAPSLHIYTLDVFALQDAAIAAPSKYGFANTTNACWTGSATSSTSGTLCASTAAGQDKYLFWDVVHPTAAWAKLVAADADEILSVPTAADFRAAVPEPASWSLMLVAMGGMGAALRRQRRLVKG